MNGILKKDLRVVLDRCYDIYIISGLFKSEDKTKEQGDVYRNLPFCRVTSICMQKRMR